MSEQGHTPLPSPPGDLHKVLHYVEMRDRHPLHPQTDGISSIHGGLDYAAEFGCHDLRRLVNSHKALVEALRGLLTYDRVERPAMRTHPHGAPGSTVRIATDKLISLEDAALAALKLAGEA